MTTGLSLTPTTGILIFGSTMPDGTTGLNINFQGADTYIGRATTDTLTNKTYDTAGTGNVFKINGTSITSVIGSGSVVLSNSTGLSANYISSLNISFLSTTTISIATGTCINSDATYVMTLSSPQTVNIAVNGANGLDTGTKSANTWYAVHLIGDSTNVNTPKGLLSLSRTAPTLPAGYNKFRWIGWVRNGSGNLLLNFTQTGNARTRKYTWQDVRSEFTFLTAGTAIVFTTISMAASVPPTSIDATINFIHSPNLAQNQFYLRTTGNTVTTANLINSYARSNGTTVNYRSLAEVITNTSQQIDYAGTQVTDALTLITYSFIDYI